LSDLQLSALPESIGQLSGLQELSAHVLPARLRAASAVRRLPASQQPLGLTVLLRLEADVGSELHPTASESPISCGVQVGETS
jgi:hypothetical protein